MDNHGDMRIIALLSVALMVMASCRNQEQKPNVVILTVDDMSCSSIGIYGNKVDDITPNIDRLAGEGFRFTRAHVNFSICNPSRSCMLTGLYAHNHGSYAENGIRDSVQTLPALLKQHGYMTAVMHKQFHYLPMEKFGWDSVYSTSMMQGARTPALFEKYVSEFAASAKKARKPFILVANTADPHRPFATREKDHWKKGSILPSVRRIYDTSEVNVFPYLPEHPVIHQDVSLYYTSVHRADECVGAVLKGLEEAGAAGNTLLVFISDNGAAFPFAKHDAYRESTWTPLIFRYPGKIEEGKVDSIHMVAEIDIVPTLLDLLHIDDRPGTDGKTLVPLFLGEKQDGRDAIFTEYQFHTTLRGKVEPFPSRSVQTPHYRYIVNFWANGDSSLAPAVRSAPTYDVMMFDKDPQIRERGDFYLYRTYEEFYDVVNDPACLDNLIGDPGLKDEISRHKQLLLQELKRTGDPAAIPLEEGTLEAFREYIRQQYEAGKIVRRDQQRLRKLRK